MCIRDSSSVTQGGNTTTYAYDIVSGDTIKNTVTDARGNVSETVFDLAGRKTADRAGVSGAGAAMTTSYQYNANNQEMCIRDRHCFQTFAPRTPSDRSY